MAADSWKLLKVSGSFWGFPGKARETSAIKADLFDSTKELDGLCQLRISSSSSLASQVDVGLASAGHGHLWRGGQQRLMLPVRGSPCLFSYEFAAISLSLHRGRK
jgi:hypothetical protein